MSDCLFCAIASGAVPATVLRETDRVVVLRDINPQAPTHVLVIPREHYANVGDLAQADAVLLAEVFAEARAAAQDAELGEGFRIVFNTGPAAGQTVDHVHAHVLGGRRLSWPPG